MKKRRIVLSALMALMLASANGCGKNNDVIKIGILEYAQVPALDNAREGFLEVIAANFEEGTYEINYKNAGADSTNNAAAASQLVSSCDIVLGIATPSASALKNEAYLQNKDIPILFTAVTDAAASGLVNSNDEPGCNVSGTSDMNPVAEQIDLIKETLPDAKKIGLIYCSNESNSKVQADLAQAECDKIGLELNIKTIDTASGIESAITSFKASGIDALYIPTDNVCASSIATIISNLEGTNILVVAGESSMVSDGAHLSLGVDYTELGKITANMAVDILKNNADISKMAVRHMEEYSLVANLESIKAFNITLPQSILDRIQD